MGVRIKQLNLTEKEKNDLLVAAFGNKITSELISMN